MLTYQKLFVKPFREIFLQMVAQLWYDPERLELVTITQYNWDASVYRDSGISYSRTFDSGDNVNDVYSWAEFYYTREVISDGLGVLCLDKPTTSMGL